MSFFETDDNDLNLILNKYHVLYMRELSYYGTSNLNQMCILLNIGNEITRLENILIGYYNGYFEKIIKNSSDPQIYILTQILFAGLNILLSMCDLLSNNGQKLPSDEFEFKIKYLIGAIENFAEKFIKPIISKLYFILGSNTVFKIDYSIENLRKLINLNKNKFNDKNKIALIDKLINLLDK
jgi:hypothetical protein